MKICLMYWSKYLLLPTFVEFVVVFVSYVSKILLSRDCVCRNCACGLITYSEHSHFYIHNSAIVFCSKLYPVAESTLISKTEKKNPSKCYKLLQVCENISQNYVWLLQSLKLYSFCCWILSINRGCFYTAFCQCWLQLKLHCHNENFEKLYSSVDLQLAQVMIHLNILYLQCEQNECAMPTSVIII